MRLLRDALGGRPGVLSTTTTTTTTAAAGGGSAAGFFSAAVMAAALAYVVYASIDGPLLRPASRRSKAAGAADAATQTPRAERRRARTSPRKTVPEETAPAAAAAERRSALPPLSLLGPDLLLLTGLPPVRAVPRGGERAPAAVRRKDAAAVEGELRTRLFALVAMGGGALLPPPASAAAEEEEEEEEEEYEYDDSCGCADCSAARAGERWMEEDEDASMQDASSQDASRSLAGGSDAPSDDSFRWGVVDDTELSADGADLSLLWEESDDDESLADEPTGGEPVALPGHNKVPVAQRLMSEVEQLMQLASPVEGEDIRNCIL